LAPDCTDLEAELGRLRAEIANLSNLPALSSEFVDWLGKLLDLVKARFGADSDEMRRLRAISPELPSEFYDSIGERIGLVGLDRNSTNRLLIGLNRDLPQEIFRRRLYDYDDLMASMIVGLRPATDRL
jgi:hypothetical protein